MQLVREHSHAVNAAVTGLSALPSTARPFASVLAMSRFLNHEGVTLPALIEPAQDAVRRAVAASGAAVALLVHDWCMSGFRTHTARPTVTSVRTTRTRLRTGTALRRSRDGRPLGPMEFRLRTANGMLTTRPGRGRVSPGTSTNCSTR